MHPLDQAQTPLAKNLTWTGHSSFSTTKIRESSLVSFASTSKTEMHNDEQKPSLGILLPKVQAETSPIFNLASSKPPQPIPIQPVVSVVAEVQPIDPIQHHVEQQSKLIPPVSSSNILPPPNARPTPKTKQIAVNGKVYSVMKPLGRGGSSVVYQVELEILLVRLDSVDEVTAEGYINEIRLLKQLQGLPRVVRLLEYEYNEEEEKLLLVMEKGDTDFATVIRTRTSLNAINPTLIRTGRKYVIHTDLKPANFLLVNGGLKFIDFGIATSIQADMTSIMKDSQCGTYNYMTPEAIKSATPSGTYQEYKISRKTDVWSLGCMLYSLIYKNPPFNFPLKADPMVIAVLKGCLDRNPRTRPSIEQLLSHPYLTCTSQSPVQISSKNIPPQLRIQLEFLLEGGQLTEEVKENIRQWM
ncbi:hypothetical protein DAPPUDRAFT_332607 [Daphnia pulex]|uniref:Protein kinase domain-containing protein n=1 Tax=Daphnia pulex TaxID=6669 RepID=E9HQE7_DAPPU|nr:hypothetical protein DAPPUDRAFT_332607 [Daphnia pulex]|eukprot:EFX66046.1 hypothetical protein DAPPUDRAFT_332607 [Daphnia pulex]